MLSRCYATRDSSAPSRQSSVPSSRGWLPPTLETFLRLHSNTSTIFTRDHTRRSPLVSALQTQTRHLSSESRPSAPLTTGAVALSRPRQRRDSPALKVLHSPSHRLQDARIAAWSQSDSTLAVAECTTTPCISTFVGRNRSASPLQLGVRYLSPSRWTNVPSDSAAPSPFSPSSIVLRPRPTPKSGVVEI